MLSRSTRHFISAFCLLIPTSLVAGSGFRNDLLLNRTAPKPRYQDLVRLERAVILNYTVAPTEDLWQICKRYKFDLFSIRSSNDLDVQMVAPGTLLRIPNHKGTLYEVKTPESLRTISQGFNRGKTLGVVYEREILAANNFPPPDLKLKDYPFHPGTLLFLPESWKPTGLSMPFLQGGYRVTSQFGRRRHPVSGATRAHKGLDLAKPYGSAVVTAAPGVVTFAGWMGGYGNMIEIRHVKKNGGKRYTRYGHLSKILVREGQRVKLYQLIGRVGSTGISTGPHLHFEVRDESGQARNPNNFL